MAGGTVAGAYRITFSLDGSAGDVVLKTFFRADETKILLPLEEVATAEEEPVITSYSIHYTKLYDETSFCLYLNFNIGNNDLYLIISFLQLVNVPPQPLICISLSTVITSYSIHYTKLYDGPPANRSGNALRGVWG